VSIDGGGYMNRKPSMGGCCSTLSGRLILQSVRIYGVFQDHSILGFRLVRRVA